jgi:GPH family glycoside/pentoside/hexuronide:cation symporter
LPLLLAFFFVTVTLGLTGFIIVASMMADVVEDVAVATQRRSEGLLFAAHGLLHKCVSGVGTFLGGVVLAVVNFPQGAIQGQVHPSTLWHLGFVYVLVVAICSPIAIGILALYNIDRSVHERNLQRLDEASGSAGADYPA